MSWLGLRRVHASDQEAQLLGSATASQVEHAALSRVLGVMGYLNAQHRGLVERLWLQDSQHVTSQSLRPVVLQVPRWKGAKEPTDYKTMLI